MDWKYHYFLQKVWMAAIFRSAVHQNVQKWHFFFRQIINFSVTVTDFIINTFLSCTGICLLSRNLLLFKDPLKESKKKMSKHTKPLQNTAALLKILEVWKRTRFAKVKVMPRKEQGAEDCNVVQLWNCLWRFQRGTLISEKDTVWAADILLCSQAQYRL